jgi:cyclic-di-GMP-binding protein
VKNSFYLVIPKQKNDPQLIATFAEPALRQWMVELPTANPGLATRLFQDLINDLISLEMTTANRLNALELLRPQFLMIEDYLRSRLIKFGFPKGEIEKKIFTLVVMVEKQFTIGYWSVVRDLTRREIGWLQGKNTALAIQRTIKGLSNIVITHYMMSYPVPDWIWFDLHSLYKLAVKLGKEHSRVSDQTGMFSKSSGVEDSYK